MTADFDNPAVGIDLGTTNTVVAVQTDDTGPRILAIPQPRDERYELEPLEEIKSAVFFESKEAAVVGAWAANRLDCFRSIKSKMGTSWRAPHPHNTDVQLSPAYVSAHILKLAYQGVKAEHPAWDGSALITVPASFNSEQRQDTLDAAELAGFRQVSLLDEPTAAFYFFFDQQRDSGEFDDPKDILVFDFGGGTLDVSIITVHDQDGTMLIDAVGRSRYNNIGGDDIDLDLAAFLLGCWEFREGSEATALPIKTKRELYQLFLHAASLRKEEIEAALEYDDPIPELRVSEAIWAGKNKTEIDLQLELTRDVYEEIAGRFFQNRTDLNIYRPITQAIEVVRSQRPNFNKDDLDYVLYTGGASRMSGVQTALQCFFRGKPCHAIANEEACSTVALGAAASRYDELRRTTKVKKTVRLLECLLTRDLCNPRSGYVEVVPLSCSPSDEFQEADYQFKTPRPLIRLRQPLFLGASTRDHQISPLHDLVIELDQVLPEGTPYQLSYRMTEDKTIHIRVRFDTESGPVLKNANVDIHESQRHQRSQTLCSVNLGRRALP